MTVKRVRKYKVQYHIAVWSDYPGLTELTTQEAAVECAQSVRKDLLNESVGLRVVRVDEVILQEL